MDYSHLPTPMGVDVINANLAPGAQNDNIVNSLQTWKKPRGCKNIYIMLVGPGGNGGAGQSGSANTARTGGGSGAAGGIAIAYGPSIIFPDTLLCQVPPSADASTRIFSPVLGGQGVLDYIGSAGRGGNGAAGGSGGAGGSASIGGFAEGHHFIRGYVLTTGIGVNAGTGNGTGPGSGNTINTMVMSGASGAGVTTETFNSGGSVLTGFDQENGPWAGGSANWNLGGSTEGASGRDGYFKWFPGTYMFVSSSGAGGASSNTGTGGAGGKGGIGSGGGGGGAGVTGGPGGAGGPGMIIISYW